MEKIAVTHGFIIVNIYCQLNQRIRLTKSDEALSFWSANKKAMFVVN